MEEFCVIFMLSNLFFSFNQYIEEVGYTRNLKKTVKVARIY